MITKFQELGTPDMVRERLLKYQQAGVNTLNLRLDTAKNVKERMTLLEQVVDIVNSISRS